MKVNISKMVVLFIVASVCVVASCSSETVPGNGGDPVFLPTGDLVYVCGSTGDDGNPGTAREPMKTIQAAIEDLEQCV